MKTESEWLNEKLGMSKCFINIPKNNEKQKKVIKIFIKIFSDRLKEIEESENNELIKMKQYHDRGK